MQTHAGTIARLAFPIVGIGASAGGFAALAALLRHPPASPGMALVVVLHLPGDQDSTRTASCNARPTCRSCR